jgi:orotidine-5'-phosphate decarboxylase
MERPANPLLLALDTSDIDQARRWVDELFPHVAGFKIGLELIWSMVGNLLSPYTLPADMRVYANKARALMQELDLVKVMADGKVSDTGRTTAGALTGIGLLRPWAYTIHANSGPQSLEAAAAYGDALGLGVTVLTSITRAQCIEMYGEPPEVQVCRFADSLVEAGIRGIVCSGEELPALAQHSNLDHLIRVVPGTRSTWAPPKGQERIVTPREAWDNLAHYLVIGSQATQPPAGMSSVDAIKRTLAEIFG